MKHIDASGGSTKLELTTTAEVPLKNLSPMQRRIYNRLESIRNFFRDYKKKNPTDPSPVTFSYGGSYLDAATAIQVVRHHHIHWCNMVEAAGSGHRVGALSPRMHIYETACDEARAQWQLDLEAIEAPGAAAGSQVAALPEGLWLPVESSTLGE